MSARSRFLAELRNAVFPNNEDPPVSTVAEQQFSITAEPSSPPHDLLAELASPLLSVVSSPIHPFSPDQELEFLQFSANLDCNGSSSESNREQQTENAHPENVRRVLDFDSLPVGVLTEHEVTPLSLSDIENIEEISGLPSSALSIDSPENSILHVTSDSGISLDTTGNSEEGISSVKKRTRKYIAPDKVTRKRLLNPKRWEATARKKKLQEGEEYVTSSGKSMRARCLQPPCDESCRQHCSENFSEETRMEIFSHFWKKITSWQGKWLFLSAHVREFDKKSGLQGSQRRVKSREYFLPCGDNNIKVCKVMFLATIDICDSMVTTALKKKGGSPDKRGTNPKRPVNVDPRKKQSVRDHIQALPRMPSHYCRQSSQKEFLDARLKNVTDLFQLYSDWMKENHPSNPLASFRQYNDVFNEEFNISFFIHKKDRCDYCVKYELSTEAEKAAMQEGYDLHRKRQSLAQTMRMADHHVSKLKESKNKLVVADFDFEKTLICPQAKASVFYYRRKLSVSNLTVVDVGKNEDVCYVYDETIARKGGNDVASFLYHFCERKIKDGATEIRLYCDNCWGQNKNKSVGSVIVYLANKFNIRIVLRFLEKGHTYNSADNVHSLIERKIKNLEIYTPSQFYEKMRQAKRSVNNPVIVEEVTQDMVYDWKDLGSKINLDKDITGKPVPWSKLRQLVTDGSEPHKIMYKIDLDDETSTVVSTKRVGRPVVFEEYIPPKAYNQPFLVSAKKYEDFLYYCNHNIIPTEFQAFYKELRPGTHEEDAEVDEEDEPIIVPVGRARKRRPRGKATGRAKKRQKQQGEEDFEEEVDEVDDVPLAERVAKK